MGVQGDRKGGTMTLVLTIEALGRLARPADALGDAVTWTANAGVLSTDPRATLSFTRRHDVPAAYFVGESELGRERSLASLRTSTATDRYLLVGTDERDATLAADGDWEYLDVESAASQAGWELGEGQSVDSSTATTIGGRLRRIVGRLRDDLTR